jgi:hypothetical protein
MHSTNLQRWLDFLQEVELRFVKISETKISQLTIREFQQAMFLTTRFWQLEVNGAVTLIDAWNQER